VDDPLARQLLDAVEMHGWDCQDMIAYERSGPRLFKIQCSNGSAYEVFLREDWGWHGTDRQTDLHIMIQIAHEVERLGSNDAEVRRRAAEALGKIGPDAAPALQALRAALADEDPKVRTAAAEALAAIEGAQTD
jgi:hypothetical protein